MAVRQSPGLRPPNRRSHRAVQLIQRTGVLLRGAFAAALLAALTAGLPWGLWHYIGWPLPDHIPTVDEVSTTLASPLTTSLLLNTLACALWTAWAIFLIDILRTAAIVAQGAASWPVRPPAVTGPLQAMAAALVGAVVLALLPSRDPQGIALAQRYTATTATVPFDRADSYERSTESGTRILTDTASTAVVRPPHNGIHDSLWRIADRRLGDGTRWPEIYTLNRGRLQADGRTLTSPNLIQPGWILRLPESATDPGDIHEPDTPPPPTPPSPPSDSRSPSPSPTPSTTPPHPAPSPSQDGPGGEDDRGFGRGVELPGGVFVGIGLVAATAAALLVVRRRRRIRYRPGSGRRDDVHIAPVVRALRQAHDESAAKTGGNEPGEFREPGTPTEEHTTSAHRPDLAAPSGMSPKEHVVGVREGHALIWDLARSRGLGLIGPGALDAARALLVDLVSERRVVTNRAEARLIIPALDARRLLGEDAGARTRPQPSPRLHITAGLTEALQLLETELLARTRAADNAAGVEDTGGAEIVLIASPEPSVERRLQAILDNGSTLGLAAILIGQWRPGGTLHVRQDGNVTAASPSHASTFTGARLFTLPAAEAQDLLNLFAEAGPDPVIPAGTSSAGDPQAATTSRPRPGQHLTPRAEDDGGSTGKTDTGVEESREEPLRQSNDQQTRLRTDDDRRVPVQITVLGRIRLLYRPPDASNPTDLTDALTPKQREVVAYLALHRDGVRRELLAATIWPDAPRDRPYNSFHATLSQLRRTLRTATHDAISDVTHHEDARYALDPQHTHVDLWDFQAAVNATRAGSDDGSARQAALQRAVDLYTGDFADGVTADWVEAPREALRRALLDSLSALVRALAGPNPRRALDLLERARELDRYNEAIYRDIARMQARLGQHDAVSRTLDLLTRTLRELDEIPSPETVALCQALRAGRKAAGPGGAKGAGTPD